MCKGYIKKRVRRFERPTFTLATYEGAPIAQQRTQFSCDSSKGVTESVTTRLQSEDLVRAMESDPELQRVIDSWKCLPIHIRKTIGHIIESVGEVNNS